MRRVLVMIIASTFVLPGCLGIADDTTSSSPPIDGIYPYRVGENTFYAPDIDPKVGAILNLTWTDADGVNHTGTLQLDLLVEVAPMHVTSFVEHSEAGRYDGTSFHRIIDEFVVQGGDIEHLDGMGGYASRFFGRCSGDFEIDENACDMEDWTIPLETNPTALHQPGAVGAARSQKGDSAGSQFYFVDLNSSASYLDGGYTILAQVVKGSVDDHQNIDGTFVIDELSKVSTNNSTPLHPVLVTGVTIIYRGGL